MVTMLRRHASVLVSVGLLLTTHLTATVAHAAATALHPYGITPANAFALTNVGQWDNGGVSPFSLRNDILFGPVVIHSGLGPQSSSDEIFLSPHNSATAAARASFGLLRLEGHFLDGDGDPAFHAGAVADAGWIDTLRFVNPALTGQSGQLTFGIHMEGNLFGDVPKGGARIHLGVDWGAQSTPALNVLHRGQGSTSSGPYIEHVSRNDVVTVGFTWGQDTELLVRAVLRTLIVSLPSGTGGGSGDVDFANTIYWTGIQSVMTGGVEITDYDLITQSGVDYRISFAPAPIPEPATAILVVIGLLMVAGTRIRGSLARRLG